MNKEKCKTCNEEKEDIAFGQCEECFEKEMKESGSVSYLIKGYITTPCTL